jgi:branched-chain amino acid transport system substrate-binding protein
MRSRFFVVGLAAVVVAVAASGCGSSGKSSETSSAAAGGSTANQASKTPIKALWIGDTTGPLKMYGAVQLAGFEGAAAYYNAHGGIDGHKVIVSHVSDNGDPTTSVSVLLQQLAKGTPTMLWGGSVGGTVGALIPVIAKKKVFTIAENDGDNQCAKNASTTCPTEWSMADRSIEPMLTLAQYYKSHGIKKVGLLQETDTLSEAETPDFIQALNKYGIAHSEVTFPATAVDLTPQLQELEGTKPQAVFMEGLGAPAGYTLTGRAKLNWNVPVTFDVAASSLDLTKLVPAADLKNVYETAYAEEDPSDPSPGIKNMLKYTKPYGTVAGTALDVLTVGWDGLVDFNAAVKAAGGKTDVNSLDAAMLHIPSTDPNRTYSRALGYTDNDHENVKATPKDFEILPAGPLVNGQIGAQQ